MARDPNDLFADVPEAGETDTGLFDDVPEAKGEAGVFEDLPEAQTQLDREAEAVRNIARTKGLSEVGKLAKEGKIQGLSALAMAQDPNAPRQDNAQSIFSPDFKAQQREEKKQEFFKEFVPLTLDEKIRRLQEGEVPEEFREEAALQATITEGVDVPLGDISDPIGILEAVSVPAFRARGASFLGNLGADFSTAALFPAAEDTAKMITGEREATLENLKETGQRSLTTGVLGASLGTALRNAIPLAKLVREKGGKVSELFKSLRNKKTARDALRDSGLPDTEIDNLLVSRDVSDEVKDIIRAGDSRTEAGIDDIQVRGIQEELQKIDEADPLTIADRFGGRSTGNIPKRRDGFNIKAISDTDSAMKTINDLSKELSPKRPQTFEQMRARALRFGVEPDEITHLGQNIETISDKLAVTEGILRTSVDDFGRLTQKIRSKGGRATPQEVLELSESITSMKILGDTVKQGRSSIGRALGRLREQGRITRAKDEVTRQLSKRLLKKNGKIDENVLKVLREVDYNKPAELFALMDDLTKTRWERIKDGISTYFISNILYGLDTWIVNPAGNSIFFTAKVSESPTSAILNKAISRTARLFGRDIPQDRFLGEVLDVTGATFRAASDLHGMKQGLTDTAAMVYRGLKTGKSQFAPASKVDFAGIGRQTPRVLSSPTSSTPIQSADRLLTGSLRVLNVQDDLFKLLNFRYEINRIAPRLARMEANKKGVKITRDFLNKEVRNIINDAAHPLHERAHMEAIGQTLKGVFQDPAGPLSKLALKARRDLPGGWLLRLFPLTFINTPIKLAARGLERTPLGFMKTAINVGGKTLSKQPISLGEVTDDLAAAINGSFLMYAAYEAVDNGWITGSGPVNRSDREAWELAGNRPYSINIGDLNIDYRRFDPLSFALGFGVDIISDYQNGMNLLDPNEVIGSVGIAFSRNFASKTYAKNVGEVMEGMNSQDPDRLTNTMSRIGSNVVGGFVPFGGLVGDIGRSDNPEQAKIEEFAQGVKNRAGFEVPKKIVHDLYGEPRYSMLETAKGIWSAERAINLVSPARITRDDTSELTQELVRIGVREAVTPLQKDIKNLPMSHDEYNRLNQIMSEVSRPALNALVNNDEAGFDSLIKIMKTPKGSWGDARRKARKAIRDYQRAGEEPQFINGKVTTKKADVVSKVITRYRSYARDIMEPQVIERLKNEGFTDRQIALAQKGEIELEDYRR